MTVTTTELTITISKDKIIVRDTGDRVEHNKSTIVRQAKQISQNVTVMELVQ